MEGPLDAVQEKGALIALKCFGNWEEGFWPGTSRLDPIIDIEYNKRLDRQRPCLEGDLSGGSNNIVQSNKSVWRWW